MNGNYAKQRGELLSELDGMRLEIDAEKRVATLILDRPPLNTVSYKARSQIAALFEEFGRDPDVGVVVVRGANGVFTSGGDVRGFFKVPRDGMSHLAWNIGAPERCPKPVIAAMEKFTFGVGWELALACDFRIATKDTLVALPEITIGQMPGSGGSQRVLRMVHAMEENGFGSCSNHAECEAVCPKGIGIDFIALLNREFVAASATTNREPIREV